MVSGLFCFSAGMMRGGFWPLGAQIGAQMRGNEILRCFFDVYLDENNAE
jgi:hypothetical protein